MAKMSSVNILWHVAGLIAIAVFGVLAYAGKLTGTEAAGCILAVLAGRVPPTTPTAGAGITGQRRRLDSIPENQSPRPMGRVIIAGIGRIVSNAIRSIRGVPHRAPLHSEV